MLDELLGEGHRRAGRPHHHFGDHRGHGAEHDEYHDQRKRVLRLSREDVASGELILRAARGKTLLAIGLVAIPVLLLGGLAVASLFLPAAVDFLRSAGGADMQGFMDQAERLLKLVGPFLGR